ncbi:putative chromosome-partitioning protein ParB [Anaerohalosphaera lusitana]|uniref:Putative chromosome-partitioning protein ParB n=1 Tax=Anaerohalosphaera lusitana TaxID=1936003 RepID=A0A1U9NH55_9BACT|nr:ParB/RepB/Spo0J family partition protein [Anaerohalosphaera lusitana]AQT67263.1 putative chromosome-partitioning protein ParB [Anaerohalosphaera lusitana]
MAKKAPQKRLGRGLDSLLGGPVSTTKQQKSNPAVGPITPAEPDKPAGESVQKVSLGRIKANPYQPRTVWDEEQLAELASSIKANGVIQPILLRKNNGHFELIAGERRLRASQMAELEEIPAIVRDVTDEEMLEIALVENIHRSDLNPIERAHAYQRYIASFNLTQSQAAERLGENRSVIANHLRLLDLPKEIHEMLVNGQLSMGHARAILSLPTDELRRKLANRALAGRLSVREVERLVRKHLEGDKPKPEKSEKPAHITDLEKQLRSVLGTKVSIKARKKGERGKITIDFYSLDEFDRLTEILGLSRDEQN